MASTDSLLGEKMACRQKKFGAKTLIAEVYSADLKGETKVLTTSEGMFKARTVVIATGASPRAGHRR